MSKEESFEFLKKSSIIQKRPITKEQTATLLHFCWCNARDLYEEACLLREHKKYARAFFLCVLSLEELSKLPITINALFFSKSDKLAWNGFWKTFNSHSMKQAAARSYGQDLLKNINTERWKKYYKKQIPKDFPLNEAKLASMYVDCYGGTAARPNRIFVDNDSLLTSIFEVVKNRLDAYGELHSTHEKSAEFVELALTGKDLEIIKDVVSEYQKRAKK